MAEQVLQFGCRRRAHATPLTDLIPAAPTKPASTTRSAPLCQGEVRQIPLLDY